MSEKIRMIDDPELVEYRTDLEGWTGQDRLYYGKGSQGESTARYANSTHKKCDCGNVIEKTRTKCETCYLASSRKYFLNLEEVEWDGESPIGILGDDIFFSDMDEVLCYCENEDIEIEDLSLVSCEKKFVFSEINLDEMNPEYYDEHSEKGFSKLHPEIAKKAKELNDLIKNTESELWFKTNKRIKI